MKKPFLLLTIIAFFFLGCKKEEEDKVSFEVICKGCTITYFDENGKMEYVNDISGSFKRSITKNNHIQVAVFAYGNTSINFFQKGMSIFTKQYSKNIMLTYNPSTGQVTEEPDSRWAIGSSSCGIEKGKQLWIGTQDGCYYVDNNGKRIFVPKSKCKC